MRIAIDLQGAQSNSRHRGIGRYTLSLAQAMVRHGERHEFILVLNGLFPESIEPMRALFDGLVPQSNIRVWSAAGPVSAMDSANHWRRQAAELAREAFLASLDVDVVHVTSLMEGFDDNAVHSIARMPCSHLTALTFYDVIPLLQSELYLVPHVTFAALYREKIGYMRRGDIFLAISESSRQEAVEHLGIAPERAVSIGAAVDGHFRPLAIEAAAEADLRRRYGLPKPFLMYSGATDERKNHLRLIKAFSLLPVALRRRYQLAIVGRLPGPHRQAFERQIEQCGLTAQDVVITGGVSDLELLEFYNLCELFVFPSWHEGFGLPALEAMACGAAVIASNSTSLPQVMGRADALFDPFDEVAMMKKIAQGLTDHTFRADLQRHGLRQAKTFSWEKSAQIALAKLEQCHAERSGPPVRPTDTPLPAGLIEQIAALPRAQVSAADWAHTARALAQNRAARVPRQLFVDVSELARRDSRGGIQRAERAVLSQLMAEPPRGFQVTPVCSSPTVAGYREARNFLQEFLGLPRYDYPEELIEPSNGDLFLLGLDLDYNVIAQRGYLQGLRDLGVKIYFVIYDLIPVAAPWSYPETWNVSDIHARWLDVIQQHDGVICISRAVADDFREWLDAFGMKRGRDIKLGFFHLGADLSNTQPSRGLAPDAPSIFEGLAQRTTFLAVATIEPRKGHWQTLEAFELLWADGIDINLVLVGKQGWDGAGWQLERMVQMLRSHPERGRRLFWLEAISDEYLERIYALSDCLLAASVAEGFGLPLIEAARHGLPIIARDIPVFKEVAGEGAYYFNGAAPAALSQAIRAWLTLDEAGSAPSSNVIPTLTWRDSTRDLLQCIVGERWYVAWRSGQEERLRVIDGLFTTEVGERREREIVSTGQAGLLMHGPHTEWKAGSYRLTLRGRVLEMGPGGATVKVAINVGAAVLASAPLVVPTSGLTAALACLDIEIPQGCADIDVRVSVAESTRIAVSLLEIAPVAQGPAS